MREPLENSQDDREEKDLQGQLPPQPDRPETPKLPSSQSWASRGGVGAGFECLRCWVCEVVPGKEKPAARYSEKPPFFFYAFKVFLQKYANKLWLKKKGGTSTSFITYSSYNFFQNNESFHKWILFFWEVRFKLYLIFPQDKTWLSPWLLASVSSSLLSLAHKCFLPETVIKFTNEMIF